MELLHVEDVHSGVSLKKLISIQTQNLLLLLFLLLLLLLLLLLNSVALWFGKTSLT